MNKMKTAQESVARTFYQDFMKAIEQCIHEANQTKQKEEYDGFSTGELADGWVNYRGVSLGTALLEDPYRLTCTVGPDGPFVGFEYIFAIQSDDNTTKAVLEGDHSVVFDSPKELAKYALNELIRRRHESGQV
jgi:hypothetical protein